MERKLSLGLRRRWSKASREGSFKENMAKADIRASPRENSTWSNRGRASGRASNRERSSRKRASAERSLRTFPRASAMAGNSGGLDGRMGNSGKQRVHGIYEMGIEKQRSVKEKTPGRELLAGDRRPGSAWSR